MCSPYKSQINKIYIYILIYEQNEERINASTDAWVMVLCTGIAQIDLPTDTSISVHPLWSCRSPAFGSHDLSGGGNAHRWLQRCPPPLRPRRSDTARLERSSGPARTETETGPRPTTETGPEQVGHRLHWPGEVRNHWVDHEAHHTCPVLKTMKRRG